MLAKRGVPFSEKLILTNDDIGAFTRFTKDKTLPFLTIGGQQIRGFNEIEWLQYLDSAGYPTQSALPPSYRQPPAEPLSPLKTASEAATESAATGESAEKNPSQRQAPSRPAPSIDRSSNPAGIRF